MIDVHSFNIDGFLHLKSYFNPLKLQSFCDTLEDIYLQQCNKIGEYKGRAKSLVDVLELMEADDKEALYQVQKFLSSSNILRSLFDENFMHNCSKLLGSHPSTTLLDGPALFVNKPNTQRLLYKWHSEAHYYPKRRKFLNVWLPILAPKNENNGAMLLMQRSHLRDFPFSEYRGFNKDSENKANHFVQYEIPDNLVKAYVPYVCDSNPGDVILFDRALVHRSSENKSAEYSFAVVARVWDPSNDLTISGNMAATPYGGDIGRANLQVTL